MLTFVKRPRRDQTIAADRNSGPVGAGSTGWRSPAAATARGMSGLSDVCYAHTSTLFPFLAGPTFAEACRDRLASIWQREAGPDVPFPAAAEQLGWRNGNPPIARLAGLLCQPALQCRAERGWNPCCRVTLLAGFRWIDLRENLAGALEPPTVPGGSAFLGYNDDQQSLRFPDRRRRETLRDAAG